MPYKNIQIKSIDNVYQVPVKKSQFYKGFSSLDDTSSKTSLSDFDLIKQDIINHFNTKKGERVMNPNFGSIIWDLLMEPLTDQTSALLRNDIKTICTADPRVTPTKMDLTEYPDGYILELTLTSTDTDQAENMKLVFDQKLGLAIQ